ncbi:MAG: hypothetical protein K2W82_04565 [Candidatus Obscuribacterales bacterium]|nr:hypothetical protein [Candidatus Obscuribacterales bacterium]
MYTINLKSRLLTAGLVALQLVAFMPLGAFADEADATEVETTETKEPVAIAAIEPVAQTVLSGQALEAARLIGIETQVRRLIDLKNKGQFDKDALRLQLAIVRKILTTGLELRTVSAKFDREITIEQQALDKLTNERDFVVAQTNNLNFLQLTILATIIDGPLGQTRRERRILNGNRLNIVSGLTVGSLALIAFMEQRGGIRHSTKPEPNMLGQVLGLEPPSNEKLPAFLWTYLNSVSPTAAGPLTRREQLLEYWRNGKMLTIKIDKHCNKEKLSVLGPHHHWWSENIKLMNNRVTMLFDLRAMVDLLNTGLVEILQALD